MSFPKVALSLLFLAFLAAGCAPVPGTPPSEPSSAAMEARLAVTSAVTEMPEEQPRDATPDALDAPRATFAVTPLPKEQPLEVPSPAPDGDTAQAQTCAGLDSTLAQLAASDDPVATARQLLVPLKDGDKVQVVLRLQTTDTAFLAQYGVEAGSLSGDGLQAFVPVARLCELAQTDPVLAISLAPQAITQ